MTSALDASCFRVVVKNTFVHIEQVVEASDKKRNRRKSDASCVQHIAESRMLFDSETTCVIEAEASPCISKENVQVCLEGSCLRTFVKNTFFHVEEAGDSCESIQHQRRSRRRLTDLLHARDAEAQRYKIAKEEATSQESETLSEILDTKSEDDRSESDFFSCSVSLASEDSDCSTSVGGADFTPQESAGSAEHFQGLCKSCVWFWRPSSCNKGANCEYCHLCDEGAVARAVALKKNARKQKKKAQDASR